MNRTLPLLLFAGLCLAGCTRNADPLEWKLQGGSPGDIDRWMQKNVPLMSAELGGEFSASVNNIRASTAGRGMVKATTISRQLDGQTVRQVLITGREIANRTLSALVENESNALLRIAQMADSLKPEQVEKQMKFHETQLARYQEKMVQAEKRLAELRAPLLAQQ